MLLENIQRHLEEFPTGLEDYFSPASHYLFEWQEYWLELPGVDRLLVGTDWVHPVKGAVFRLHFENRLGLTILQPYAAGKPLESPLWIEVISRKFPQPNQHYRFFRSLLDDLFSRASRLPFNIKGRTSRGVGESLKPPTPLFVFHFLLQYGPQMKQALEIVGSNPHRLLTDHSRYVPLSQASEADPDVLLDILHSPDRWVKAHGFPLAQRLQGFAPTQVWQRRPEETIDTPENRFVLAFLRQLVAVAESLPTQNWWSEAPVKRQDLISEITALVRRTISLPLFDEVGVMERVPLSSQVLLRREGYRAIRDLYWLFHQARRPFFAPLQHAIEVRDIATLYEQWTFFFLLEEITLATGISPEVDLPNSVEQGLRRKARARYDGIGELVFDQDLRGYSLPLRPDFTWMKNGRMEFVLDAKFRLERSDLDAEDDNENAQNATVKYADLYKMHTYKDSLGVRAAVVLYPGDTPIFYHTDGHKDQSVTLKDILIDNVSGIGALVASPDINKRYRRRRNDGLSLYR